MDAQQIKSAVASVLSESKPLDFESRTSCLRNMEFVYHLVIASEDLLDLGMQFSHGELHTYYHRHWAEEVGHAGWLRADLDSAGREIGSPPQIAVAMVGSLHYLIRYVDPCALLGYMVPMECFSMPIEHVEAMEALHGPAMFRTLRYHAENDLCHGADVLEQINRLPDSRKQIVLDCALQTARYVALASHTF